MSETENEIEEVDVELFGWAVNNLPHLAAMLIPGAGLAAAGAVAAVRMIRKMAGDLDVERTKTLALVEGVEAGWEQLRKLADDPSSTVTDGLRKQMVEQLKTVAISRGVGSELRETVDQFRIDREAERQAEADRDNRGR